MINAHETAPVVARVKPQTVTADAEVTSDIIDMRYWQEVVAYINLGDYAGGNDGTVAALVEVSNDGTSFTSAANLTGKALTAASFTGSAQDDHMGVIRWKNDEMIVSGTAYRYARLSITPSAQNLTLSAVCVGFGGRYQPGSDYDISTVTEIIS